MLKDYFLKRKINKALQKEKSPHTTLNYDDVRKVGVLIYLPKKEQHKYINKFVSDLKGEGKEVVALACFDNKAPEEAFNFRFHYLSPEHVSFWGNITSENALSFAETSFDYLFCITADPDMMGVQYVLAHSKAKCRVGIYQKGMTNFYELMVALKEGESIEKGIKDMRHYTKAINKNEYEMA
ncbi:hypothetical protein R9C00_24895 [Flammeovirgaceae bacterium SG7u.111]|nr:hypothetical protein [Flammeovirgaceae bacterium SG7u.132]WPO34936.1 hypothetical protein R9C00_24895 [Flammeovirgaceae bacterium SG7u.111]